MNRTAAQLLLLAGLLALVAGSSWAQPVAKLDAQVAQSFGEQRIRLALPLREPADGRTGIALVYRQKEGAGEPAPALRGNATERALQLELQRPLGAWRAFGHAGWRSASEVPGVEPQRGRWYAELGMLRAISPDLELGAYADVHQDTASGRALRDATVYGAWTRGALRWQLSLTRGLGADSGDSWLDLAVRAEF